MTLLWSLNEQYKYVNLIFILLVTEICVGYAQKKVIESEILHGPTNGTVFVDTQHTFHCIVRGPSHLRISWQRKGFLLDKWLNIEKDDRHVLSSERQGKLVKKGSLVFPRVLASDAGFYRCAVNAFNKNTYSTTVFLVIHARAEIVTGPISQVVKWGETVRMSCEVVGLPLPERSWFQDGVQVMKSDAPLRSPIFVLKANHSCNITCRALNVYFNGSTTVSSQARLTVIDGVCELVKNGACLPHLTYETAFRKLSQPQQLTLNNQLVMHLMRRFLRHSQHLSNSTTPSPIPPQTFYTPFSSSSPSSASSLSLSSSLSTTPLSSSFSALFSTSSCFSNMQRVLCHYANPQCSHNNRQTLQVTPLCRESCQSIQHVFCGLWWQEHKVSDVIDCSLLPSTHVTMPPSIYSNPPANPSSLPCVLVNLFNKLDHNRLCYKADGKTYGGVVNTTVSGRVCQRWGEQQPHQHPLSPSFIPHLLLNHCRNPAGLRHSPWCYTTDPEVVWEYCGVPKCDGNMSMLVSQSASSPPESSDLGFAFLVLASLVGLFITLVLLVLVMVYLVKRRRRKKRGLPTNGEAVRLTSVSLTTTANTNLKADPPLLDRNSVVYVEDIANGAFGLVFKAFLSLDSRLDSKDEYVAIRMLKQNTNEVTRLEFVRQASIMSQFKHSHILKLLGVCFVGDPSWVAVEFMERGDLRSYLPKLRLHQPDTCTHYQLSISMQTASALQYLEHRRFLHRDLAARNFLVSACNMPEGAPLVKLADFTFTIELQAGKGVYVGMDDEAIAVRWAAPEAIQIGFFTFASDVWSFGVVLWEIFSFSDQPYDRFKQFDEISKYVRKGGILADPCPHHPAIYRLIKNCWALSADDRCNADFLFSELSLLHSQYQEHKVF